MRGRKPEPTHLKLLRGNPGKRSMNKREPQIRSGRPECPPELSDAARREFYRICKIMCRSGAITTADKGILVAYCCAFARMLEAEAVVKKRGAIILGPDNKTPQRNPFLGVAQDSAEAMRKYATELGLSPSARSRLVIPAKTAEDDEFAAFLNSG